MIKNGFVIILCVISLIIGFYAGMGYISPHIKSQTNSTVILNKIKNVFKIINVEGQFSEIIQEKSYSYIDISPLRKSIIIRANAKVLVGYELDSSKINIQANEKIITIKINSTPKVISNEINMDYFDIQQGTFNQFTPDELNLIHDKIRDNILRKAEASELMTKARSRNQELLNTLKEYCELLNWKLIIVDDPSGQNLIH